MNIKMIKEKFKGKVKQIFLIMCQENTDIFNFTHVFEQMGEYKIVISNIGKQTDSSKKAQYVYINTSLSVNEITEFLDKAKVDDDLFVVLGITLDMLLFMKDSDVRQWCLEKQEENIQTILILLGEEDNYEGKEDGDV